MSKFRLLSKKEIDFAKAKDRQRELEEGKKLAGRVDSLREMAANEEAGLQRFRIATLTSLDEEMQPKKKELSRLDNEIRTKRAEYERFSKPLTEAWAQVKSDKAVLDAKKEEIIQKEAQFLLSVAANIQRERENEMERERIADERVRSQNMLAEASIMSRQANEKLSESRVMASTILSNAQAIETAALQKEKSVNLKAGYVENTRKQNEIDRKENEDERARLQDAWKTLERTSKRIHGK